MGNFKFDLFYGIMILLLAGCSPGTPEIEMPNAVSELTAVEIGGLEQWLLLRGEDRSKPILLWLHGGPGSAQMAVHREFNQELEKEFVVVHWDQRGAGKSNHIGFREETMTLDRFIEDAHEVTTYLKDRFDREKIYLLGHSWGTQFGILTVQRYPDDYHAFISVGQVVDPLRAEEISYAWLKQQVDENGSAWQKRKLEQLGPPYYGEHDRYVTFAKMKDEFGGGMDVGMGQLVWVSIKAEEYSVADHIQWFSGASRGSGPMWDELRDFDLFRDVPSIPVPVWFVVGKNDYNTPAELVQEYYQFVEAPEGKTLIVMDGVAHTPFLGDPDRFNREVIQVKKVVLQGEEGV